MKSFFDKLDKLAWREKAGLAIAFFLLFCCLMDQFVIKSVVRKMNLMDTRIQQAREEQSDARCLMMREKELKAEYGRVSTALAKAVSPAEAVAAMKGEISEAAKQAGLVINAMDQREARPKTYCDEFVVEVSKFDADINSLMSFLYRVETSPGMMRVAKLNMTPGKTQNSVTGSILLAKIMVVDSANRPKSSAPPAISGASRK